MKFAILAIIVGLLGLLVLIMTDCASGGHGDREVPPAEFMDGVGRA